MFIIYRDSWAWGICSSSKPDRKHATNIWTATTQHPQHQGNHQQRSPPSWNVDPTGNLQVICMFQGKSKAQKGDHRVTRGSEGPFKSNERKKPHWDGSVLERLTVQEGASLWDMEVRTYRRWAGVENWPDHIGLGSFFMNSEVVTTGVSINNGLFYYISLLSYKIHGSSLIIKK